MEDIRIVKFEMLLNDIDSKTHMFEKIGTALRLIYDYDSCNDYAKLIMDHEWNDRGERNKALIGMSGLMRIYSMWDRIEEEAKDIKVKIEESKNFIEIYDHRRFEFIFLALMVLVVDKRDAENNLALICDFAKMFKITEDEFEDIVNVVKIIFHETPGNYSFKSENIKSEFDELVYNN